MYVQIKTSYNLPFNLYCEIIVKNIVKVTLRWSYSSYFRWVKKQDESVQIFILGGQNKKENYKFYILFFLASLSLSLSLSIYIYIYNNNNWKKGAHTCDHYPHLLKSYHAWCGTSQARIELPTIWTTTFELTSIMSYKDFSTTKSCNKFTNMSQMSLSHLYSSGEFSKKVSVREGCSLVWSLITMWVFFSQIGFQFISVQHQIQVGSWIISINVIINQFYLIL